LDVLEFIRSKFEWNHEIYRSSGRKPTLLGWCTQNYNDIPKSPLLGYYVVKINYLLAAS